MKKLLLLSLTILLFSCGDSDSDSDDVSNKITPPSWITGTYMDALGNYGYEFKLNDFCRLPRVNSTPYGEVTCWKDAIDRYENELFTEVEQEITDSYYSVKITIDINTFLYVGFDKVSDTRIEYQNQIFYKQ